MEEYLEKSKPIKTKRSIKSATTALVSVIKQLNPDENNKLEELPDLADYLEQFFKCVVKEDGSIYNASTLTTYYNSICRFFMEKTKVNIKTNEKYVRVSQVLSSSSTF